MSFQFPDPNDDLDELLRQFQKENVERLLGLLIPIVVRKGLPRDGAFGFFNDGMTALAQVAKRGVALENPEGFVMRVAINNAISEVRRKRTTHELPDSERLDRLEKVDDDINTVVEADLEDALEQLRPRRREAVVLCHLHLGGLTYKEAAKVMGIGPRGVESNLKRGIEDLREILKKLGYRLDPRKEDR